jgi:hypothetical protein
LGKVRVKTWYDYWGQATSIRSHRRQSVSGRFSEDSIQYIRIPEITVLINHRQMYVIGNQRVPGKNQTRRSNGALDIVDEKC